MPTAFPVAALLAFLSLSLASPSAAFQAAKPRDFEVKAAYLLNFGRFVTWPPAAPGGDDGFTLCVLGRDPFGAALDETIAGERIDGRSVVARRIALPNEVTGCRILFVSGSEVARLPAILAAAAQAAVLTVSDIDRFTERGGMIQFVSQDRRVRFRVNAEAVDRTGLALSSELLRVAVLVTGVEP